MITLALLTLSLALHPTAQQARAETPGEFYVRYVAAVETAQTVEELSGFLSESVRAEITAMKTRNVSIDIRAVRGMAPASGVRVLRTVPTQKGDVRLYLEGTSRTYGTKATGTVIVTQENGTWKMADFGGWTFHAR